MPSQCCNYDTEIMILQGHAEDVSYDKAHIPALILSHTVNIALTYIVRVKNFIS